MAEASYQLSDFKLSLASNAESKSASSLLTSITYTEYFKKLSALTARVIPGLFIRHISSQCSTDDARVKELHSIMSDVICITNAESLLSFFSKYSSKVITVINLLPSDHSQHHKELAEYLGQHLHEDLRFATHLDVNDLVIALKKGILTKQQQNL